tara:strand:- start:473 stop:1219 length:747 start_codon:yes stop_codon:yes gene_type:complete
MEPKFKIPTETVELPSKGLLYPEDSPLAKGTIEMKYMTAKEEDILTNQNFIKNGSVIDKLLKSLIVTEGVDFNKILVGDKNAIMVAARILSYGKIYKVEIDEEIVDVDLSKLENDDIKASDYKRGENNFKFKLPETGNEITFKLLTHGDERAIDRELKGLKKINKNNSSEVTTRMKHIITSVNGMNSQKDIRDFVDNYFLAADSRALRKEYTSKQPDVNFKINHTFSDGREEEISVPMGLGFFWPDDQ